LTQLPEDGLRYEILDGILIVSPSPTPVHQRVIGRIFLKFVQACPPDHEAFVAPLAAEVRPVRRGRHPQYWIIDPIRPSIEVSRLDDAGDYKLLVSGEADEPVTVDGPITLTVRPIDLVRPVPPAGSDRADG